MRQLVTEAIILSRTDYGEADRIIRLLTPDFGKLSLLAKGVRRIKSKLAGGIELFSVSEITFIKGRGEVGTLVSTRLKKHYAHVVADLQRTMIGYELIKQLNRVTEDQTEADYFELLSNTFEALNDVAIPTNTVRFWFYTQLLRLGGHTPNLQTDTQGEKLTLDQSYNFSFEHMAFMPMGKQGQFGADHIKFLRLTMAGTKPKVINHIQASQQLIEATMHLLTTMITTFLRV